MQYNIQEYEKEKKKASQRNTKVLNQKKKDEGKS